MPVSVSAGSRSTRLVGFFEGRDEASDSQDWLRRVLVPGGEVVVASRSNPDRADSNHDAAVVHQFEIIEGRASLVLALADGAGGQPRPIDASRLALEGLEDGLEQSVDSGVGVRHGVMTGFELANQKVMALKVGAASTLSAVTVGCDAEGVLGMRCFHVGDSTVALTGQRGRVKFRSMSHSPVGYGVAAGLLAAWDALVHEERHLVDNLVGMTEMRIDVGPRVEISARDTVILASDGVWDNLRPVEVIERLRSGQLDVAVKGVVELAVRRMSSERSALSKPDDVTVVAYRPRVERSRRRGTK